MSKQQWINENLKPGEIYAGLLLGKNGEPDQHLALLPGEAKNITWDKANAWAKQLGARLPTRREQALLFANTKDGFESTGYWSGESPSDSNAWGQNFYHGYQYLTTKSVEGRARAVRTIQLSA